MKIQTLLIGLVVIPLLSACAADRQANWERRGYDMLRQYYIDRCLEIGEEDCYRRYSETYDQYRARRQEELAAAKEERQATQVLTK